MNETYDVIILGTGLKECILSGLLSVSGKKVLHLDRNDYYGAESASLNLKQLFTKFEGEEKKDDVDEKLLGQSKNYSVDLCPKFIMGCGNLVKMLLHTKVTRYLEFRCIDGSYVYKDGKLCEVPMTKTAALNSSLMGIFQKRRYANFLQWVLDVDIDKSETWQKLDLKQMTMKEVYDYWKLDENTQAFTGHAVALYTNDDYLNDKSETLNCISNLQLYARSLARFEKSPYIYPVYGLGGLPEGFSRLAAVHGGTYMLRRDVKSFLFNNDGTIKGVCVTTEGKDEGEAYCKQIIGDPSYFVNMQNQKVKKIGQIAKWLCIMDHSIEGTSNAGSAQIILPGKQTGHAQDIYISVMNWTLQVAPQQRFIAMISANVYTNNPKKELEVAYKLLGKVLKDFFYVTDQYIPINNNNKDNIFVPSSMDATSHFELATREVMQLYKEITGNDVDLNANPQEIAE
jgi:Rab GDP dissociation inhibitor